MPAADPLVWETDIPLFSRRMLGQWSMAMLATALVMFLILGIVFAAQGEWDSLVPMLAVSVGAAAGLWLLGLLIMLVLFRGKYRVRYTLSDKGLLCETIDTVAKKANRLAIIAGFLGRSPQTAGAGLIALSRETEEVLWKGAFRAVYDPKRHFITLGNAWRSLMWVQCTPENYAEVAAAVEAHMRRRGTAERLPGRSPLPVYLARTALVLAASFPLFPLADEFDTGLFLPIFTLCFALATVWLINLFGWVVIGGLVAQAAMVVVDQLEIRESFLRKGEYYRAYEVLSDADVGLLLVAAVGAGLLIRLSVQAIKGRWLAALLEGFKDMGG